MAGDEAREAEGGRTREKAPNPAGRPGGRLGRLVPRFEPPRLPDLARFRLDRLRHGLGDSLERELEAARGLPWLAVAFAAGCLGYFALPSEPYAPALAALAAALLAAAVALRHRRVATFRIILLAAMLASGAALAKLRTDALATPILERPVTATVIGWVEAREGRRGGWRLTLRVVHIGPARLRAPPTRVTITVRGAAPLVGAGVSALARLRPPSGPALPGGYDFARNAFYEGIGATGFAYGTAKPAELGSPPLSIASRIPLERLREAIRARIQRALPGDTGQVATSLVIGDYGGLGEAAEDDMRQSGLAHVLSVSGLHMVLVAGVAFWTIRALLALFPALALRRPIKKWAAAGALAITFFYLLISGLDVAAQRSFVMTAIVFSAILVDRRAISMRNIAISGLIVLAIAPESILGAGFQMSFAATIALIAGFDALSRRRRPATDLGAATLPGRAFRAGATLVGGLALTSLLGGIGTTPFALYHFQRMAPLSIVANVLAMPPVDFTVMPLAFAAVLAMPFGLDQPILGLMGFGIDWMLAVAAKVSEWSSGSGGAAMPSVAALLIFVAGFLWLTLLGERWRYAGLVPMLIGGLIAFTPARPDLLVAADGRSLAIRGADGRYAVLAPKPDRFTAGIWLRADGDLRPVDDPALVAGNSCDPLGCIAHLPDGRTIALSLARAALDEDCRRAALVVTPLAAPAACAARTAVIDARRLARTGALALTLAKGPAPPGRRERQTVIDGFTDPAEIPSDDAGDPGFPADALEEAPSLAEAIPRPPTQPPDKGWTARARDPAGVDDRLLDEFTVTTAYPPVRRAFMPPVAGAP